MEHRRRDQLARITAPPPMPAGTVGLPDGLDEAGNSAMTDRLLDLLGPGLELPILLHNQVSSCWPTLRVFFLDRALR